MRKKGLEIEHVFILFCLFVKKTLPVTSDTIVKASLTLPYAPANCRNCSSLKSSGILARHSHPSEDPTQTETSLFLTKTFWRDLGQSSRISGFSRVTLAPALYRPSLRSIWTSTMERSEKESRMSWNKKREKKRRVTNLQNFVLFCRFIIYENSKILFKGFCGFSFLYA